MSDLAYFGRTAARRPNPVLPLHSAVPSMLMYARYFLESGGTEPITDTGYYDVIHPAHPVSGAVTVSSGAAVPTFEELATVSRTTAPARPALLAALWDRIMRYVRMAADGDEDATPVPAETIEHTRQLLSGLPSGVELPQATVSADGEIIFTWFRSRDRLEAILAPDRHLTWVSRIDGSFTDGDVIALDKDEQLSRFYGAIVDFFQ